MKVQYRDPTLIEQMAEVIANSKRPIDHFELSPAEFQSVINHIDKTKSNQTMIYSYKGIQIKVADE